MKPLVAIAIILSVVAIAAVWASTVEQFEPAQPVSSRLVTVTNFPNPQNVAGTVNVGNLPTDAGGNVMVAVQNGGGTAPLTPMFVELLESPIPVSGGQVFLSDVFDTSGYTVVGLHIETSATSAIVTPEWRWDSAQSFGAVDAEDMGDCSAASGSRRVCAVRGPELRIRVVTGQSGTRNSVELFLTNDIALP